MKNYSVGVIGLKMGREWSLAAYENAETELVYVYDKDPAQSEKTAAEFSSGKAADEDDFFSADLDIIVVATPDHLHSEHCIRALSSGSHVICEKPLAPTVKECVEIIKAAESRGRFCMVGQVGRYAPGFRTARRLVTEGEIGEIAFIESEYAHDYTHAPGVDNWRRDPLIKREGFIGGGCHALDIVRWFAGDPEEVFCYTNRKLLDDWPTDDTGIAVCRFPSGAIGKVFVSVGAKRKYTMRTVIYGKNGAIECDNTSPAAKLYKNDYLSFTGKNDFWEIPVNIESHNVGSELEEFVDCLNRNRRPPTDAVEGAKTVAFGESALESARTGLPVVIDYSFEGLSG